MAALICLWLFWGGLESLSWFVKNPAQVASSLRPITQKPCWTVTRGAQCVQAIGQMWWCYLTVGWRKWENRIACWNKLGIDDRATWSSWSLWLTVSAAFAGVTKPAYWWSCWCGFCEASEEPQQSKATAERRLTEQHKLDSSFLSTTDVKIWHPYC